MAGAAPTLLLGLLAALAQVASGGGEDLHADLGGGLPGRGAWGYGSIGQQGGTGGGAGGGIGVGVGLPADPKAAKATNSIGIGRGLTEGLVGKQSVFEVIPRDMFGDGTHCARGMFTVQAVLLSAARDEDSLTCEEHVNADGLPCTRCGQMDVCFRGADTGPCNYVYTPSAPGFLRITVALNGPEGPRHIQGSPFRAHIGDGRLFIPGMSFLGYLSVFFTGVGGGLALLGALLGVAWHRWKQHQRPSEDDLEMQRLEQIASELEMTHRSREDRSKLLQELSLQVGGRDRSDSCLSEDGPSPAVSPAVGDGPGLQGWGGRFKEAAGGVGAVSRAAGAVWAAGGAEGGGCVGEWGGQRGPGGVGYGEEGDEGGVGGVGGYSDEEDEEGADEADRLMGGIDALWRGLNLDAAGGGGGGAVAHRTPRRGPRARAAWARPCTVCNHV